MKLGVIADDFTGATDIAGFLVEYGIPTIQINGVPDPSFYAEAEAYVISLKTRSCPVDQAVDQSRRAMAWLQQMDCDRFYFKYCSTFDSTPRGNIGPVADALLQRSGSGFTVVCPGLPINGRTVYKGYLFVHDQLLSESGMKEHPLNPMGDAKLSRLLEPQTDGRVASVYAEQIDRGAAAVRQQLEQQAREGYRYAVLDTLHEQHLLTLAEAVEDITLLTGGSGLAMGLAQLQHKGAAAVTAAKQMGRPSAGKTVVLSGSCSEATNRQVGVYREKAPSLRIDPDRCLQEVGYGEELFQWAKEQLEFGHAPMLYATAAGDELRANRDKFGGSKLGVAIESLFGRLAARLAEAGVRNFIVAGGETSGQVVQSLEVQAFRIGPQVSPGVPWVKAVDGQYSLVLKSGNFGDDDFFARSQECCAD